MVSEHHGASKAKYQAAPTRLSELLLTLAHHPTGLSKQQLLELVPSYHEQLAGSSVTSVQRVLNRDIAALRSVGYAIVSQRVSGANHAVYVLLQATQPDFNFTALEKLLLRTALKHWHSLQRGGDYFELLLKLAPHLYNPDNPFAQLTVDNAAEMLLVANLSAAITAQQQVRFNYALPGRVPHLRTVSPLQLHRTQERWHLLAFEERTNTIRTFLLSRITEVTLLTDPAVTVHADEISAKVQELQRVVGATSAELSFTTLTPAVQRLLRLYNTCLRTATAPNNYTLNYGDTAVLTEQLVALDTPVVIHMPQQLRQSYHALLATIAAQHETAASRNFVLPPQTAAVPPQTGSRLAIETRCLLHTTLLQLLQETGDFLLLPVTELLGLSSETVLTALTQLNRLFTVTGLPHHVDAPRLRFEFAPAATDTSKATAATATDTAQAEDSGWVIMEGAATLPLPAFTAQDYSLLRRCIAALIPQLPQQLVAALQELEERLEQLPLANSNDVTPQTVSSDRLATAPSVAAELLAAHISAKNVACFGYIDAAGKRTSRTVVPLRLELSDSGWRLHGLCLTSMARKNFLVARMSQLSIGPRADFVAAHNLDAGHITEILKGTVPGSTAARTTVTALVCIAETAKIKLHSFNPLYLATPAQPLHAAIIEADAAVTTAAADAAWHYAKIKLWDPANIVKVVQAAPGTVEVLEPPELRQLVADWAAHTRQAATTTSQTVSTQPTVAALR
ncbi:helix-turn-helix transcriptional regulator [Canibacter oris]|uniref:Putative DNA-binding transcriptional regulator YafY n=1 Tax=Canibacter oris TaxID=1365628 RepID=A0A840DFP5_9MICO|nr:WYL domain-containing protein [Canibacter oris]MBB4071884.1 putative DNA-binding transcriptional regulator YafY [Canibacter oris]